MKILFIAYLFPPHGGGGVIRAAKLCKYLPDFGIDPVVLCADDKYFHTIDESLLDEIPKSVDINRVKFYQAPRPTATMRKMIANKKGRLPLFTRLRSFLTFPDPNGGFRRAAFTKGDELLAEGGFSAIVSTYPPPSTHMVAVKLAEKWNLPLILDYRDAWYFNPIFPPPTTLHRRLVYRLEKSLLKKADAVVTIGDGLAGEFVDYFPFLKKVGVVTNGYDEESFAGIEPKKVDKFTISHVGSMYSERLPLTLLKAIGACIDNGVFKPGEVDFRVVGMIDENAKAAIKAEGISVSFTGIMGHKDAIKEMVSNSANLLIIKDIPGSETILSGKLFEYLRAGRPIIAQVPPAGDAAELIRHFNAGYVLAPGDEKEAARILVELYERYRNGETGFAGYKEEVADFSRESLAGRYADIIRKTVERS